MESKRGSDVSLPVAIGQIFTWPPQSGLTWFCFLFPLIELDRRVSRIQLSEKGSRFCPRKADGSSIETNQRKLVVQELVGVPLGACYIRDPDGYIIEVGQSTESPTVSALGLAEVRI